MKLEEHLNILRKEYEKVDATWHLKMSGWEELEKRIDILTPVPKRSRWLSFAVSFALILLFIGSLFGAYKVSLAAMPGDVLYPVKILSEKLVKNATGSNQVVIDNRANEIIGLSKKEGVDKTELQKVVLEYKKNVEATKKMIPESGKQSEEFQKKLEGQHSEFDRISNENPEIGREIKDASDVSSHSDRSGD